MSKCTVSGEFPENDLTAPTPTDRTRADGQKVDHWILCENERAKGFIRPVRKSYIHAGIAGPKYEIRDLTDEEKARYDNEFDYYEEYPKGGTAIGRFWTKKEIESVGKGCGTVTHMPLSIAETYARQPGFYGSTFCCGCNQYLPVGREGEFIWDDGSNERVGT